MQVQSLLRQPVPAVHHERAVHRALLAGPPVLEQYLVTGGRPQQAAQLAGHARPLQPRVSLGQVAGKRQLSAGDLVLGDDRRGPAIRGEQIAAIAITEPDAGSDVAGITTVARRDGDHYIVNGRKIFITNGARCHWALVVTKAEHERGHKGFNLLVIEKGTPGFEVTRKLEKLGMHSSDTAELLFENCRVPVANLIGEEGEGFKNLMWELQGERMIAAAGAIAGAASVFEYTAEYARNRKAFGQPIAQFQVIKHKLVDMGTKVAAIQAFVYQTAKQWDQGEYPVREISQAKLLATQVACEVADEAIQILGGHGYMSEFPVERAWRDARLARIGAGTDEIMKEIIAKTYGL